MYLTIASVPKCVYGILTSLTWLTFCLEQYCSSCLKKYFFLPKWWMKSLSHFVLSMCNLHSFGFFHVMMKIFYVCRLMQLSPRFRSSPAPRSPSYCAWKRMISTEHAASFYVITCSFFFNLTCFLFNPRKKLIKLDRKKELWTYLCKMMLEYSFYLFSHWT